ncbi:hypothetical protein jhhlp_007257 [Lomentospora prolificans]|uniref:RhoGAP-domain-containing protein n=1 Tax=Lomentospora prolificans TaxID=41688 RepID=A0A2N3N256_9PEZI|nr:hypothetical protein jhhlp_007257 [Lomentospora prolificans]
MAGPVSTPRENGSQVPARNSSIDSAISAISSKSQPNKGAAPAETPTTSDDIAHLIKTAGSAEAVIQYLLKEKNSQTQQNSQLWRLVDKQRAMILGLNKDLERALKDKEKYRKKLKEVLAMPELSKALETRAPNGSSVSADAADANKDKSTKTIDLARTQALHVAVPDSPNMDSDSQKHSPVDMAMAPYPITPPADGPNPLPSAVGELLDPAHAMPKPEEHALDGYNHEALERATEQSRKEDANQQIKDLPIRVCLVSLQAFPTPPARPPPTGLPAQPQPGEDGMQFPAPPPRKGPPAPLQLAKGQRPDTADEEETDTDYDDILEVDEIVNEKRGRRRTREEDERDRHIQVLKEAEARSLSKKSKSPQNQQTPNTPQDRGKDSATIPLSPRHMPPGPIVRETVVQASLNGMMNGDMGVPPALLSPGLPASPRPFGIGMGGPRSPLPGASAPPLSPRGLAFANAPPLSPRPPRQPIPLPPGAQLTGASMASNNMALPTPTPKPLNINKTSTDNSPSTPTMQQQPSPTYRTTIFKGLVTEEYPDLLLPPNALPSVDVRVASSRMKPSRASLISLTQLEEDPVFTLAIISRADGGELWRVEKDSASLAKLDSRMKQCAAFTAKTPDRSLFSGHAPAKLDARRIALDHYLDELMNSPLDVETAVELCKYLSTNTLPPNSEETVGVRKKVTAVTTRKGAGGRALISGYLTKRGKNFGGWKARYFALEGPLLKYYETPGGAHLGTIKLQNAQIGKQAQHQDNQSPARGPNSDDADNQYRHAFLILEPKKKDTSSHVKHVLCAESDMERDQWVETLLQWIDYRDPDDEDQPVQKKGQQERRGSNDNAGKASKGQPKKKREQGKPQHQQSNSETLIGVSYDSTTAGDAPQGMPRGRNGGAASDRPRTAGGERPKTGVGLPGNPHDTDFQIPVISAPRDPQVISDSSAWGAKMGLVTPGLAPPSYEEKKQRKRSFFGFGPKTRSSSDGQDSLFDGSSTPPQNEYKGPIRQVFGAPLSEAVRFNGPVDINVPLPAVVYRCIQYLDARNAICEEGIFRLSGSNVVIKQLRERFNNESDVDLVNDRTYYDIHAVASLLKLYLRELPTTILTRDLHLEFLAVTELSNLKEKIAALSELVVRLPQANATLLKYLIAFLIKIINNADMNKMTVRNVGIVFSPTLNIPAPVFAMFLQNYEPIFGLDPEEYELPSPTSESDTQSQGPGRPSFEPQPRPSTSQGSNASPHRQRLMQNVMDAPRASPTPPLLMNLNEARGSPTPPPSFPMGRPTNYEPGYLAQQQNSGVPSMRPAYESGFNAPSGFDPTSFYNPPRTANPGYDRPIYEGDFSKRRESAIFGAGAAPNLTPQPSKSRLREETLY